MLGAIDTLAMPYVSAYNVFHLCKQYSYDQSLTFASSSPNVPWVQSPLFSHCTAIVDPTDIIRGALKVPLIFLILLCNLGPTGVGCDL